MKYAPLSEAVAPGGWKDIAFTTNTIGEAGRAEDQKGGGDE